MFPRRKRLSRDNFKGVATGRRLSSPHFSVTVPRTGTGYAVVVGKGAVRLSTGRHLLKRRILAILTGIALPQTLVVFPKASAGTLSNADLKTELTDLISKISR